MVLILINCIDRHYLLRKTLEHNLVNSGIPADQLFICARNNGGGARTTEILRSVFKVAGVKNYQIFESSENIGNSNSLNRMLATVHDYDFDYYVVIADDLRCPSGWLSDAIMGHQRLRAMGKKTGQCAFTPFHDMHGEWNEDLQVYERDHLYTIWVLPWDVFKDVGYFMAFSNYGIWDGEFGRRMHRHGYYNFALKNWKCEHLDWDHLQKPKERTPYRKMKDEQIQIASKRHDAFYRSVSANFKYLHYEMATWEGAKKAIESLEDPGV